MTEAEFFNAVVWHLEGIKFCAHVCAFGIAWLGGALSWKLFVYGKNHREIW